MQTNVSVEQIHLYVFGDTPTKWPIEKKNHQNIHPQPINMDLQKGTIIKSI